jgi:alkaline phosphatase D
MPNPRDLEGSVPGAEGRVRVRYGTTPELMDIQTTEWVAVKPEDDYTHIFRLSGLKPATRYYFSAETSNPDGSVMHKDLRGQFETAPPADQYSDVTFTVITGQAYRDADDPDGFLIYDAMGKLNPKFLVPTGDTVYYDSDDPAATTIDLARYHWHRMYSYPKLILFHQRVPGYWEKDDHDVYADDSWPGLVRDFMGDFSFEQGLKVYAEQAPMSDRPYRTFRWGKGLQVWLTEGRDFRSPNTMDDGPEKSIWGAEQKKWLMDSLLASDADWKVLVSPTPIVGPDRSNKRDNHSNVAFQHEGDEFRTWAQKNLPDNFFIACGDRHWQYHSVHPATKVQEFSSGPASDQHAGGTPGETDEYHRFHRVLGGFLSVNTKRDGDQSTIAFRLHAVDGSVVYEYTQSQPAD